MGSAGRIISALTAGFFLATTAAFLAGGDAVEAWATARLAEPESRLAAACLIFALLAGDIVLPVPSSLTALASGALFGPLWGTLIAGAGLSLGALAGLVAAGRLGRDRVRTRLGGAEFARLERALARYAPLIVLLARPVPVLSETSVLVAGACGARITLMAGPILLGSFAMAGAYAWLGSMAHDRSSFLLLFAASCLLPVLGWAILRAFRR